MTALRPIGVYCPINGALEYPAYWCDESPSMTTMMTEIASDPKFMIISSSQPISVAYSAYSNPPYTWIRTPTEYITRSDDHDIQGGIDVCLRRLPHMQAGVQESSIYRILDYHV